MFWIETRIKRVSIFDATTKPTAPIEPRFKAYGFEVDGGMGFIADGIRIGSPKK